MSNMDGSIVHSVVNPFATVAVSADTENAETWERPAEWLPLPIVNEGEEKIVGLLAVANTDGEYAVVRTYGADVTIDWGDGTIENVTAGRRTHQYDFSSISSALTTEGHKQVIVMITRQDGETDHITGLDVAEINSSYMGMGYVQKWLDLEVSMPYATILSISSDYQGAKKLERFKWVGDSVITSLSNAFLSAYRLQEVDISGLTNITNFESAFNGCTLLPAVPAMDYSKVTTMRRAFLSCHMLEDVPSLDLSACLSMEESFFVCHRLRTVGDLLTPLVTTFKSCFFDCFGLESVGVINMVSALSTNQMFYECRKLSGNLGDISLPNVTDAYRMLAYTGYSKVGDISFPLVTNIGSLFEGCFALKSIGAVNVPVCTEFGYAFASCKVLGSVTSITTGAAVSVSRMFYNCFALQVLPTLDLSSDPNVSYMVSQAYGLTSIPNITLVDEFSVKDTMMDADALVALFNQLPDRSATTSGTLDISYTQRGVYYLTQDQKDIAINKNWTLTT